MKINTKRFIKLSETIDELIAFGRADKAKKLLDKLKSGKKLGIQKGKPIERRGPYRPKESPFLTESRGPYKPKESPFLNKTPKSYGFSDPTLDQALEGHAEKHSKSHMAEMKRQMAQGKSFKEAHMIAMRKVGR